jgi:hypothetical protein
LVAADARCLLDFDAFAHVTHRLHEFVTLGHKVNSTDQQSKHEETVADLSSNPLFFFCSLLQAVSDGRCLQVRGKKQTRREEHFEVKHSYSEMVGSKIESFPQTRTFRGSQRSLEGDCMRNDCSGRVGSCSFRKSTTLMMYCAI